MNQVSRLCLPTATFAVVLAGWAIGAHLGAITGLALGLSVLVIPWWRQPLWLWAVHYFRRGRPIVLDDPMTVTNDLSAGGVRFKDGVAIAAIRIFGRPHLATYLTSATVMKTGNMLVLSRLLPMMRQSLGLELHSVSVVSLGSRRRSKGDYARVYDTLVGPAPYAGTRQTWLVLRIRALENADALEWRTTVGAATLAAAQRMAAGLRCEGIRARVATTSEITDFEGRLGCSSLQNHNRRWRTLRHESGWQTTYAYRPERITADVLAQSWCMPADGVIQNLTLFPDGAMTAAVTVRTPQPPNVSPSTSLQPLPGEQAGVLAANLCLPLNLPRGLRSRKLDLSLAIPIGPSGVLLGRAADGSRLLLPLGDPQEHSRVVIAAEDHIAKRIIIRAAAAGERITIHSTSPGRWDGLRMAAVTITDQSRPAPGTTVSVVDGSVSESQRTNTIIEIVPPDRAVQRPAHIEIRQTAPATVEVLVGGERTEVTVELFRAENRYLSLQPSGATVSELAMAD